MESAARDGSRSCRPSLDKHYPALLAVLTLGAVSLIVLFIVLSRQFIQGLSAGYGK